MPENKIYSYKTLFYSFFTLAFSMLFAFKKIIIINANNTVHLISIHLFSEFPCKNPIKLVMNNPATTTAVNRMTNLLSIGFCTAHIRRIVQPNIKIPPMLIINLNCKLGLKIRGIGQYSKNTRTKKRYCPHCISNDTKPVRSFN